MRKDKQKTLECIAYLAVKCDIQQTEKVERLENRQEQYIRRYAKAHGIKVVGVVHSRGLGQLDINRQFDSMVELIRRGKVDGIIAVNMLALSANLPDAYLKVGKVRSAGGVMVTVDEGCLELNIRRKNQNERKKIL